MNHAPFKNIFFSTGEVSGDYIASLLVKKLLKTSHNIHITAFGGRHMRLAGASILDDLIPFSTIGFYSSLLVLPVLLFKLFKLYRFLQKQTIHLFILVDHQGWNLFLARFFRLFFNAPIVYYFPPNVSIWGHWNTKKILQKVDLLICPFYNDFLLYKKANTHSQIPIIPICHPLLEHLKLSNLTKIQKKPQPQITSQIAPLLDSQYVIGLFPGSRKQEVKKLFPKFLQIAAILHKKYSISFLVPVANPFLLSYLQYLLLDHPQLDVFFIEQADYSSYLLCHAGLACSGTLTLELALLNIPFLVAYQVDPLTYFWTRFIFKIQKIALPNILLNKNVVQELVQNNFQIHLASQEIEKILQNRAYRKDMLSNFRLLIPILSQGYSSQKWIQKIISLMKS